jgi:hypothetical protein
MRSELRNRAAPSATRRLKRLSAVPIEVQVLVQLDEQTIVECEVPGTGS